MGALHRPAVDIGNGQEVDRTHESCRARRLAPGGRSIKRSPGLGRGPAVRGGTPPAARDPGPAESRMPARRPLPIPRPPLSLRCALKSQMGREERGSPRPAPSQHLDKHAPPAPPPAPDRRPGGRDGQAAGAPGSGSLQSARGRRREGP